MQVIIFVLYAALVALIKSQCPLPTPTDIENAVEVRLTSELGEGTQTVSVTITNYSLNCLAADSNRDEYRFASFIATYIDTDTMMAGRFLQVFMRCESSQWDAGANLAGHVTHTNQTDIDFLFTTPPRTDCRFCTVSFQPDDPLTGCHFCDTSCTGLRQCTSGVATPDNCCNYYDDDVCVAECTGNQHINDDFECVCNLFYQEPDCTTCIIQPSDCNGGIPNMASCQCNCEGTGYEGETCTVDIDECALNPTICENDGNCSNVDGGYNCICDDGYVGDNCEIAVTVCIPDNPCINGECIDLDSVYECNCTDGYSGTNCEININECDPNPCANSGICTDLINDYSCTCTDQFMGITCELDVDECQTQDICQNGGTCSNQFGNYSCTCPEGFNGVNCEQDINECASGEILCLNNGICRNIPGGYRCLCSGSWSGSRCDMCNIDNCTSPNCDDTIATCNSCQDRFSLINGECVDLQCNIRDCTVCDTASTCRTCSSGFILDSTGSACTNGSTDDTVTGNNGPSIGLIIGIVLACIVVFILIAIIIAAIVGYRIRKNRNQYV